MNDNSIWPPEMLAKIREKLEREWLAQHGWDEMMVNIVYGFSDRDYTDNALAIFGLVTFNPACAARLEKTP